MESDSEPLMHYGAVTALSSGHIYEKEEQTLRYNPWKVLTIVAVVLTVCGSLIAFAANGGLTSYGMDFLNLRAGGIATMPATTIDTANTPTSAPTYYMTMLYVIQVRDLLITQTLVG